ncbi:MAG: molecular chaperone TorD family protein [Deferribacteraceae bacterium]|jgi:TorA maturation chaperone TorD|nr:molecular chaperone TorD family protein [Deferribacteraceae bacterium]
MEDIKTLKDIHFVRNGIYSLFGIALRILPDKEHYDLLKKNFPILSKVAAESGNKDMRKGFCGIKSFLSKRDKLFGKERDEYEMEALRRYTTLFCLKDSVPMEETFYTSGGRVESYDARDDMVRLMRKHNMHRSKDVTEYDDHISIELAFMAKLAEESMLCLEKTVNSEEGATGYDALITEQIEFHKNHFNKWIKEFVKQTLKYNVDEKLFKPLLIFLRGFISEDRRALEEMFLDIKCLGEIQPERYEYEN